MQGRNPVIMPEKFRTEFECALSKAGWMDAAWLLANHSNVGQRSTAAELRRFVDEVRLAQKAARKKAAAKRDTETRSMLKDATRGLRICKRDGTTPSSELSVDD